MQTSVLGTCLGLGFVAALLGRSGGSDWDTVFSLLARRSGWECCDGSGRVWLLSLLLGTYFGDSKKNTEGGRVKGQRVKYDEDEVPSAIK